ncbi:MAG: cereblon family protein [Nitrospirota bacterium]
MADIYTLANGLAGYAWTLKSSEQDPSSRIKIKTEKKFGLGEDHVIICRKCGNSITTPDKIIAVNGDHTHTFTNPEGFSFDIGCFSSADGCYVYGEPTVEHTWFKDFRWNYSVCSSCLTHLGWHYERGEESFFGLILDLITDTSTTH